tara:strand:- start:42 stop:197 length:156 start_codon:yes stop_codon:yes gene_type:complete
LSLNIDLIKKAGHKPGSVHLEKVGNHLSRTGITPQPQAALIREFDNGHKIL